MFNKALWIPVALLLATSVVGLGCDETIEDPIIRCVGQAIRDCTCDSGLESTQQCSDLTETWGDCKCDYASMRFCHSLQLVDEITQENVDAEFWMSFDDGDNKVTLSAMTEKCDTERGVPCVLVPAGEVVVEWGNGEEVNGSFGLELEVGTEYATIIGWLNNAPSITAGEVSSNEAFPSQATDTCSDFSIF